MYWLCTILGAFHFFFSRVLPSKFMSTFGASLIAYFTPRHSLTEASSEKKNLWASTDGRTIDCMDSWLMIGMGTLPTCLPHFWHWHDSLAYRVRIHFARQSNATQKSTNFWWAWRKRAKTGRAHWIQIYELFVRHFSKYNQQWIRLTKLQHMDHMIWFEMEVWNDFSTHLIHAIRTLFYACCIFFVSTKLQKVDSNNSNKRRFVAAKILSWLLGETRPNEVG